MLKYLIPRFPLSDLPIMIGFALIGVLIAGTYGIIHDQITFTIGPEYFRNFKFQQFAFANFGFGERIFVSFIGFLATWWVGLISGWIITRRALPNRPRGAAIRQIWLGFAIVFASAFIVGLAGYLYGLWRGPDADYTFWQPILHDYQVTDTWGFMRVAYIHYASYFGGFLGIVITYFVIRPAHPTAQDLSRSVE